MNSLAQCQPSMRFRSVWEFSFCDLDLSVVCLFFSATYSAQNRESWGYTKLAFRACGPTLGNAERFYEVARVMFESGSKIAHKNK